MEKKMFHERMNQIEVPQEEVLKAIQDGVRKGNSMKAKKNSQFRGLGMAVGAAAVLFISSSVMIPSVGKVMADIPLLSKLYENDKVAENLASQQLITELNEKAAFAGIDVTVTEAYYDGAMIGVSFDVKGNVKGEEDEIYAFYEIFDRDSNIEETMELVKLVPTEDGYMGHIQLSYPRAELPAETTLPFNIIGIGEVNDNWKDEQGKWNFDVPIKQLPFETVALGQASELGDYKITFEKLITGKSSTAIDYTLSYPEEDQRMMLGGLFDDKGKHITGGTSDSKLEKKIKNGRVIEKRRITLPVVPATDFIEVRPVLDSGEEMDSIKIVF
ncbi:DUF4179 domain-containing protein [Mesobacillus jeotgali]|uniref:DUF4179 domain-containing protein n=1 Tax=Mesobacillus jeotgali TaxID=129985 RepID=UPI0009A5EF6F|nr:DUF4179 domain-containing protein [Mesobacillus jeotgali]